MDPQLLDQMKALLQAAYDAGRKAGAEEMRAAILRAASGPQVGSGVVREARVRDGVKAEDGAAAEVIRAPRGALPSAVRQALALRPGQTELELAEAVRRIDPQISPRSIGGQLRRFRGTMYRQDGRRWFLIGEKPAETAEAAPSGVINQPKEATMEPP